MPIPIEDRAPTNYDEAAALLGSATAFVKNVAGGGIIDVDMPPKVAAQVANAVAMAQVRATLAVADRLAEIAHNVDSLDGAVRDLHETLRSHR